jgi:hypothetical protein
MITHLEFFELAFPELQPDGSMVRVIDDDFWQMDSSYTKRQWKKIQNLLGISSKFQCNPDELSEELTDLGYYDMRSLLEGVRDSRFHQYIMETMEFQIDSKNEIFLQMRKTIQRKKKITRPIQTRTFKKYSKNGYIQMLVQEVKEDQNVPQIPLIQDTNTYQSDGFSLSGFITLPNLNFTEYLMGNMNQAYTDCLLNIARTVSVKYAKKKHHKNPKKMEKIVNEYLYESKLNKLPFPKMAKSVRIHSLIVPLPAQIEDKDYIEDNIPFPCEKWVLDVLYDRTQLNNLIRKGILIPDTDETMIINKPKQLAKKYHKLSSQAELTFNFLGYKWLYILKPFKSIDANCYLYVNIIVGKNRTFIYNFHLNPTSNKLINFNTMRVNKTRLQEESGFIKDIMGNLIKTDFLTDFKQNRSLTITDIEQKEESPELTRTIYEIIAQTVLETKIKYSRTKLKELHLTTDIKAPKQHIYQALQIAGDIMARTYEELAINSENDKKELQFRKYYGVSRARTNEGVYYQNFLKGKAHIVYPKGYRQIANKYKRIAMRKNVDPNILKHAKINANEELLRLETQLRGFNTIQDNYEIETHKYFVHWIQSILAYIKRNQLRMKQFFDLKEEIIARNSQFFIDFLKEEKKRSGLGVPLQPKPPD